jgi:hypothetical protein
MRKKQNIRDAGKQLASVVAVYNDHWLALAHTRAMRLDDETLRTV